MAKNPADRFQSARQMQEDIEVLLKLMWPKKFQMACKVRDSIAGFVGREEELKQLRQLFADGVHSVFVTGEDGIGKTEFAVWAASQLNEMNKILFSYKKEAVEEKIRWRLVKECRGNPAAAVLVGNNHIL